MKKVKELDRGWQLQGFIEDAEGRLRLQSDEEHRVCMGCHDGIGVTVDQTFSFPRTLPGAEGWRYQDLRGIPDAPQVGHRDGEILTYFRRVGAGDELRANTELFARYFPGGRLDEAAVLRAADLAELLTPSRARARALALDTAYIFDRNMWGPVAAMLTQRALTPSGGGAICQLTNPSAVAGTWATRNTPSPKITPASAELPSCGNARAKNSSRTPSPAIVIGTAPSTPEIASRDTTSTSDSWRSSATATVYACA